MKNLDLNELLGNFKATNQLLLSIAEKHNILNAVINNDDCILQDIIDNNNSLIDSFKNHQLNDGWISIFDVDNPPPKNEFVLVTDGFDVTTSRIETFFEDGEWLVAFENPDITHWQPLPQPPKE